MMGLLILIVFVVVMVYFIRNKKESDKISFWMKDNNSDIMTIDDIYNEEKVERQKRVDKILDKISRYGYQSLTKFEREFLKGGR